MRLALLISLILMPVVVIAATARAQSTETIGIVSMDADITGNTATSLGPLNACTRAEPGSSVTLDLVVDAVPASRPFIAYQITIEFDSDLLTLTTMDNEFLLGVNGPFEPFEGLSDPLPDTDGEFTMIVADLSELENAESGKGVLTRLTFTAQGSGLGTVAPVFNPPDEYPALIDVQNTTIGVDSIGAASVAVGRDCEVPIEATPVIQELPPLDQIPGLATPAPISTPTPVGQTPEPTASGDAGTTTATPSGSQGPTSTTNANNTTLEEGDGGTGAGAIAAVAALAAAGVALAGGGAFMLLRRRGGAGGGGATP